MNTRDRRASALAVTLVPLRPLPGPGALDAGDRAQLAGAYRNYFEVAAGTVAATLPSLVAAFEGIEHPRGSVGAELPAFTASLTGHLENTGTVAAELPSLASAFAGGTPLILGLGSPAGGEGRRQETPPVGTALFRRPPAGGAGMLRNVPPPGQ